jgi:hypothetical protein
MRLAIGGSLLKGYRNEISKPSPLSRNTLKPESPLHSDAATRCGRAAAQEHDGSVKVELYSVTDFR